MNNLDEFFIKYKIKPNDYNLYKQAFSHPSLNNGNSYERLEFLGDSVLYLVVTNKIFRENPSLNEGELTKIRARMIQSKTLANLIIDEGLDGLIMIGSSMKNKSVTDSQSILEDVFESLLGAIFLDQGYEFVTDFILSIFKKDFSKIDEEIIEDYKSKLQELIQADTKRNVEYRLTRATGPMHSRLFEVDVFFNGILLGNGKGSSKKAAEQMAAKSALEKKVS